MYYQIILTGIFAGGILGIPIGPNGTLSLYRSVRYGWYSGTATALGSVASIAIQSVLAALFMDKLLKEMEQNAYTQTIYTISGTLMIVIGIFFLIGAIKKNQKEEQSVPLGKFMTNFCSAFFVSLFNPKNIVAFSAVIISFGGLTQHGNITVSTALLFGLGTTISVAIMFSTLICLSVSAANKYLYSVLPILKYFVAFMFFTIGIIRLVTV